ncbi:unnamed protein product [Albugo candida]|uniref:Uncharacterized protein n=1 Tax=Albugo candida TaxID=65357 RepID=A0A024GEX4_9STRA|nr:unnamed protein product [Albugo candida]|eukprot:CCI45257.1 unnamed protein product [Albugo candida]
MFFQLLVYNPYIFNFWYRIHIVLTFGIRTIFFNFWYINHIFQLLVYKPYFLKKVHRIQRDSHLYNNRLATPYFRNFYQQRCTTGDVVTKYAYLICSKNEFVACHARSSELHPLSFVWFLYSDDLIDERLVCDRNAGSIQTAMGCTCGDVIRWNAICCAERHLSARQRFSYLDPLDSAIQLLQ